jgi:fatty-acyl-CoA synthase
VIGLPDDKWSETVKAFVVLKPGTNNAVSESRAHVMHKRGDGGRGRRSTSSTSPGHGARQDRPQGAACTFWDGRMRGVA